MKKMTCNQLGGACDMEFHAETFEEMAALSKNHAMDMLEKNDPDHLAAMQEMQTLMQDPNAMMIRFQNKKKAFNELPDIA